MGNTIIIKTLCKESLVSFICRFFENERETEDSLF